MLIDFEDRHTLFDSLIICRFFRDLYPWEAISDLSGLDVFKKATIRTAIPLLVKSNIPNDEVVFLRFEEDEATERVYKIVSQKDLLANDRLWAIRSVPYIAKSAKRGIPQNTCERCKKLAFNMTSGNFVKGYEQTWTVDATPSGSRFSFTEQVKLPYGIIGKVMELFARRNSETTVREMLTKLKSLAEA